MYGCECWTLKINDKNKLNVWWRKQLRKLQNITLFDHITIGKLYEELETKPLTQLIEERKWRYVGHLYRYGEERWAKFCLTAKVAGGKDFARVGNRISWLKTIKEIGDEIKVNIDADFDFSLASSKDSNDKAKWKDLLKTLRENGD